MGDLPGFVTRALDPASVPAASAVAARAGAHGVYVGNFLARGVPSSDEGDVVGFYDGTRLVGLAFFGARGNLIVLLDEPLEGDAVALELLRTTHPWRIALAPDPVIVGLSRRESRTPLVQREQLYYGVRPSDVPADLVRSDVRPAERRNQSALLSAALDLNEVDLHVDRRRVHKPWLRESIKRRVRTGKTLVIDDGGMLVSKLDIGSEGACGLVVEGVYTVPQARRRGLAAGLVATVAAGATQDLVCLHVAADNHTAVRAYELAGMRPMGSCGLLLRA